MRVTALNRRRDLKPNIWMGNTKESNGIVRGFYRPCPVSGLAFYLGRLNMITIIHIAKGWEIWTPL